MLQLVTERSKDGGRGGLSPDSPFAGKKVYIPPMAYGSGRCFAAAFRALGVDADITPASDHRTREIGSRHTSGDECYPAKVTVGDFIKILERPETDAEKVAFFMPTADGPCRFGQYAPMLRRILEECGYGDAKVLSPTSKNSYADFGDLARPFLRTAWRMLVAADILQKMLLITRPHEMEKGATDAVYEECLNDVCRSVENVPIDPGPQLEAIKAALVRSRARFHSIEARRNPSSPLIGVVGEIFCRLNTFSNEDLVRRLEEYGAEAWLSDLSEWLWYTMSEQFRKLKLKGRQVSKDMLAAWIRRYIQQKDEHALMAPFREDFAGFHEPPVNEILEYARPYLPQDGALGEMVLSVGKAVYLAKHGADGIVDISPFTCMNGIVCEAIYPRISRDLGGIPIRTFYFDGTQADLDRDLGVYMELVRTYQKKKQYHRPAAAYPSA